MAFLVNMECNCRCVKAASFSGVFSVSVLLAVSGEAAKNAITKNDNKYLSTENTRIDLAHGNRCIVFIVNSFKIFFDLAP